jgi:hypothetical protein
MISTLRDRAAADPNSRTDLPIDARRLRPCRCQDGRMAFVRLERKQRWGLLIAVIWIAAVVVLAIVLQRIVILASLGLVAVLTVPFRKQK